MTVRRKTVGGPWIGVQPTRGAVSRECPKCPAGPHVKCLRWVVESWREGGETHHGAGRWETLGGWHTARSTPGSSDKAVRALLTAERRPCEDTGQHGYHWTNEAKTTWCRGRTRS